MEIIPVKNVDEVLKVALVKPLKELNGLRWTTLKIKTRKLKQRADIKDN